MPSKWKLYMIVWLAMLLYCDGSSNSTLPKKRVRRYLTFLEKTVVFVRLNIKFNMVSESRIYAQAPGYRVNYPMPKKRIFRIIQKKVVKRDVYESMEQMLMHHGFDGRACVLKTLCDASSMATPQSNILLKLYKKVFTIPEGDDQYYPYLLSEKCDELEKHCPLSLMEMTRYTDD